MDGETVTVTWGEMLIAPVAYNNFKVGPFSMTVRLRTGETAVAAGERGLAHLEKIARAEYARKLELFVQLVQQAARAVKAPMGQR